MSRLAGTCFVTIDGVSFAIVGEGTYKTDAPQRTSLVGQSGYHGFSEMPQAGAISWKGRDASNVSIGALNAATDVTVVLELANGKTVVGRNMARVGDPISVNTEDGTFPIEFEGPSVSEQ